MSSVIRDPALPVVDLDRSLVADVVALPADTLVDAHQLEDRSGAGPDHRDAAGRDQRDAGRAAARALPPVGTGRAASGHLKQRTRALRRALYSGDAHLRPPRLHRDWLLDNARLIVAAEKTLRTFPVESRGFPELESTSTLRICALVEDYLEGAQWTFDEDAFVAFLSGVQECCELQMGEIWAAKPALQLAVLERIVRDVAADGAELPVLITTLRTLSDTSWKETFAALNLIDPILARDPAAAYSAMDDDSRDQYRHVISELAKHSSRTEREVAEAVLALAEAAEATGETGRGGARRAHVGFYLIDRGVRRLREHLGYRSHPRQRIADAVCARPTIFYLAGIAIVTAAIGVTVLDTLVYATIAAALLLIVPATQAGVDFINTLTTSLVIPRRLPKLDFSKGIPDDHATLVAVPAILINERHVHDLVLDMEIRYLANRDPNIAFALVTNSPDSQDRTDEQHAAVHLCRRLIGELNERYGTSGRTPFYLLHRFRAYNPSEGRWMGWERKRGKLLDLNQLLRGVRDRFPIKVGNVDALRRVQYVITLDSDTQLPRDAARRLVGTIAHPLNRAVVDETTKTVVEGYGVLQPRISVSTRSASRSWLASLYSGESGFDIYTRAVSDVYQDLFGEGIFTGKGIYEVDTFREALERRFPSNTLLSHDLIEGLFARAGLVSDIELVDDYPTHFSAYCRRRHRWMRGDWQILRWLLSRVPDFEGRTVANPLALISKWKILDNLRRSLIEPAMLVLLLACWFVLPGSPLANTAGAVALLFLPAYWRLAFSFGHVPWRSGALRAWATGVLTTFFRAHLVFGLHLAYLLHDALLSVDAIARSLARMFVTRRQLLQWETAAEAALRRRGTTDAYLEWSPWLAALLWACLWLARPEALMAASPVLLLWVSARPLAHWLNQPPRRRTSNFSTGDVLFLREQALRTWRFFADFSTPRINGLIPDAVRTDGVAADRLSPTNLAFLLNARVAAVHLGYLTLAEFVARTNDTLTAALRLPRYRGHFLNWYDAENLAAIGPRFVSTVDSGNLVAALWTLKQSALAWARETPSSDTLWEGITDVARMIGASREPSAQALCQRILKTRTQWKESLPELEGLVLHFSAQAGGEAAWWAGELLVRLQQARAWCETSPETLSAPLREIATWADTLATDMDFRFLYDSRRKLLSVGYDLTTARVERSNYDLLASEARIASFVAIAKGDIAQESWFHLGRTHITARDRRVMLSWTGTLFEYLMPALWFRHRPRTILRESMRAAVGVQRKFARSRRIPWGFSESGHVVPGADDYGYGPLGLPELALKRLDPRTVVVSPYSSFLALLVDPGAALDNLRHLKRLGCVGPYGFFEALDYSHGRPRLVGSWMAHHQGMILLAIADVLFKYPFQRAFHADPHVRATERLLDERVPRTMVAEEMEQPRLLVPEESVA